MKGIFIAIVMIVGFQKAEAQSDSIPLYQQFPLIPVFSIMTAPDSIKFTKDNLQKKKATIIMLFSPDCDHCQVATKDLLEHIGLFKTVQVIMVSSLDFRLIKKFYEEYKLAEHPDITVGRDGAYFLNSFYKPSHYPALFLYNKKGKLVKAFLTSVRMETVAASL